MWTGKLVYTILLFRFAGTLFVTVIVEDSTVMGVTQQLSAMETGGGASVGVGGASLLGNQQGAGGSGSPGNRTVNPFGGSPSSLGGGSPSPSQFNQSNATILPNLTLSPANTSAGTLPTGVDLSSRQLLGNRASELDTSITGLTDRTQPDIVPAQGDMSGSNSTRQQRGNETGQQLGTGTGPLDRGNFENMMSSDDSGTGDIYPS